MVQIFKIILSKLLVKNRLFYKYKNKFYSITWPARPFDPGSLGAPFGCKPTLVNFLFYCWSFWEIVPQKYLTESRISTNGFQPFFNSLIWRTDF